MEKINKIIDASITALYDAVFGGKITNHKDLIEIGYYVRSIKSDLLAEQTNPAYDLENFLKTMKDKIVGDSTDTVLIKPEVE